MTDFSIVIEIQLNFKNVEIITKRNNYSLWLMVYNLSTCSIMGTWLEHVNYDNNIATINMHNRIVTSNGGFRNTCINTLEIH